MERTDGVSSCRPLRLVAHIQAGYLSRARVRPSATGTHVLLQAKDVSPERGPRLDFATRFEPQRNAELYRVSCGDILLTARGQDHRAHLIDVELGNVLASSVFYVIRARGDIVPGYLAWWLNQPDAQAALQSASSGTGIGYIARSSMENLPVVVPPLVVQHRISGAMNLRKRQRALQARLDQKREELIHAVCRQAVQQEGTIP